MKRYFVLSLLVLVAAVAVGAQDSALPRTGDIGIGSLASTRANIALLDGASPKFRVEMERYEPTYNPAYLAVLNTDVIFLWTSMPVTGVSKEDTPAFGDGYSGHEVSMTSRLGYAFPLGNRLGMAAEVIWSHQDNSINSPVSMDFLGTAVTRINMAPTNFGGSIGIGFGILDFFSLGASFHYYHTGNFLSNLESAGDIIEGSCYSFDAGFLFQAFRNMLRFDFSAVYTPQRENYLSQSDMTIRRGGLPLILEGTLSGALLNETLFPAVKAISELYYDGRPGYFLRVIPIVEFWPFNFLSLRGGYEYSQISLADKFNWGQGFLVGLTLKLWRVSVNLNFTYREKPLHVLPGYQFLQSFILFGITYNPGLLARSPGPPA